MKLLINRDLELPPFACDMASLQALVADLARHFGSSNLNIRIDIQLRDHELSFACAEELINHQHLLPNTVRKVRIYIISAPMTDLPKSVIISSFYGDMPTIRAQSDNVGWAAGATEIARDFALRHKAWYAPIRPWMASVLAIVISYLPTMLGASSAPSGIRSLSAAIAWAVSILLLWNIFARYRLIFPPFELRVRQQISLLQRHSTEITVAASAISAIAAILALFAR